MQQLLKFLMIQIAILGVAYSMHISKPKSSPTLEYSKDINHPSIVEKQLPPKTEEEIFKQTENQLLPKTEEDIFKPTNSAEQRETEESERHEDFSSKISSVINFCARLADYLNNVCSIIFWLIL